MRLGKPHARDGPGIPPLSQSARKRMGYPADPAFVGVALDMGMLLKDYPGIVSWPPLPGGAFNGHNPPPFPVDQKVMVTKVGTVVNEFVPFTCKFHGNEHTYDLQMEDKATAEEFARWLVRHVGKTLEQFGEFPLDC